MAAADGMRTTCWGVPTVVTRAGEITCPLVGGGTPLRLAAHSPLSHAHFLEDAVRDVPIRGAAAAAAVVSGANTDCFRLST